MYVETEDFTVFNQSAKDVYYKPEDGFYGISNKIKNGYGIKINVDGIATSKHSNQVFKIPGKFGFSPSTVVNSGGEVQLDFDTLDKLALEFQKIRKPNYHYGWSTFSELDKSWKKLFELAKLIK